MTTKEKLASLLEAADGKFISGNAIADSLGITRAAIWKSIRLLEEDGYTIEAVRNRGYRLARSNDAISRECVEKYLGEDADKFSLEVTGSITSTNTVMKDRAQELPNWHAIIAQSQSEGRGRSGRSFYSPADTGLYISVIQRPVIPAWQATKITTAAAVAACRAIEECTDKTPTIKWVNDVFVEKKKVCGILTEASFSMETGELEWVVMGIGFNVYEPEGGFPSEIADIAGAIASERTGDLRSRIAASFLVNFRKLCGDLAASDFYEEYRRRSFLIGKQINVIKADGPVRAIAVGIDDECRLEVRYPDGTEELLSSGEVSIRSI